jgi:hypothetical protein
VTCYTRTFNDEVIALEFLAEIRPKGESLECLVLVVNALELVSLFVLFDSPQSLRYSWCCSFQDYRQGKYQLKKAQDSQGDFELQEEFYNTALGKLPAVGRKFMVIAQETQV